MGGGIITSMKFDALAARAQAFLTDVTDFPVLPTAHTLWERFRQDRLGLTASAQRADTPASPAARTTPSTTYSQTNSASQR